MIRLIDLAIGGEHRKPRASGDDPTFFDGVREGLR